MDEKKMLFFFMNAIQELTKIKAIIEHLILHQPQMY
jgi:hypothetical protein